MTRHDLTILVVIGTSALCGLALTARLVHPSGQHQSVEIIQIEIESAEPESAQEAPWVASFVPLSSWKPVHFSGPGEVSFGLGSGEPPIRFSSHGARGMGIERELSLWEKQKLPFRPSR